MDRLDMKGYIVCVYESINDNDALKNYAFKAREAVEKYKGKFLIRGGKKIVTEGRDFIRTVVIEFPSFDEAKQFFYSQEYQQAHELLNNTVVRNHQIIEAS
tara:strand:+ start:269 stop:571 length:303 start_codon:yes stop_codon:yes gene_type:complete